MPPPDKKLSIPTQHDVASLEAELAATKALLEKMAASMGTRAPLAKVMKPEYRGTKTYRVRVAHYRKGTWYPAGSIITVTDEVPSKTWEPVEAGQALLAEEAPPAPPAGRPNDVSV